MKQKLIATLSVTFLVIFLISCGSSRKTIAVEEGWDLLGELKVDFVRDKDQLDIHNTNRYTAIRFKVENKDTRIKDVQIVFQSGDKLEPLIDDVIIAGEYSKVIELSAEGKNISHIEFKYRSTGSILKGRADVLVFGKRYPY